MNSSLAAVCMALLALQTFVSARELKTDHMEDTKTFDWRNAGYKTNKPSIGILAQRCHDCPGRRYLILFNQQFFQKQSTHPMHAIRIDLQLRRCWFRQMD